MALVVKSPPDNLGDLRDTGLIPGSGRSPRRGNGNPLQYSCLENPTDREVWWVSVHGDAKGQTLLKQLSTIDLRFVIRKMMLVLLTIPSIVLSSLQSSLNSIFSSHYNLGDELGQYYLCYFVRTPRLRWVNLYAWGPYLRKGDELRQVCGLGLWTQES